MKYFSLGELLAGIPLSALLGAFFACVYRLFRALIYGVGEFFASLKKNLPSCVKIKKTPKKERERHKKKISKRTPLKLKIKKDKNGLCFVFEELLNFFSALFFALIFSVFLYIVSDGIPRAYICITTLASFFTVSKIFKRPLDRIFRLLSNVLSKILIVFLCIITYLPRKLLKNYIYHKKIGKIRK